jgi:hypothetical protein
MPAATKDRIGPLILGATTQTAAKSVADESFDLKPSVDDDDHGGCRWLRQTASA